MSSHRSKGPMPFQKALAAFFILVTVALIWPVYPLFAGIEPRLAGLPLSLWYLIALVLLSFGVLLTHFLYSDRDGRD